MSRLPIVFLILSLCSNIASAKVYKWVDENGKVHYSDKPMDDKAKTLDVDSDISAKRKQEARAQANKLIRSQQRQLADEREVQHDRVQAEQKQQQEQHELNQACAQAKDSLRALKYQAPVYQENEKGEKIYLDDETRKKETIELQTQIEKHCSAE